MFLFHAALLTLTLVLGERDLKVKLYLTNLTFVESPNGTSPRFQLFPNYYQSGELYLTWLVAAFFACSAIAHFGNAILWRKFYESNLEDCRVTSRWIEYFFSAPIMILAIAYGAGIREQNILIAIALLIASTMPFGYLTEVYSKPISDVEWCQSLSSRLIFHFLGYIPQLTAWYIIVFSFYNGSSDANEGPPDFVYLIIWLELVLFFSFGFVQLVQIFSYPRNYYKGEIAYQWLSLISKGLLGALLLSNVLVLGSNESAYFS
jgi:hypothetical protein